MSLGLPIPITRRLSYNFVDTMPRYARSVNTVDINSPEETETDRMWRQIDSAIHYRMR